MDNTITPGDNVWLTTYDNPYNPFREYGAWWKYDHLLGHNTSELLARYALTSNLYSDERNNEIAIEAMKTIISLEPTIYKIVKESDFPENKIERRSNLSF